VATHQYWFVDTENCPDMKATFPKFKGVDTHGYFKNFDPVSLDLLLKMIVLDPSKRISMKEALRHPYFNDLSES
jgi:cyclin-dependent kinase 2